MSSFFWVLQDRGSTLLWVSDATDVGQQEVSGQNTLTFTWKREGKFQAKLGHKNKLPSNMQ